MAYLPSNSPPVANPDAIISPQFCARNYSVDLAIVRKGMTIIHGNFVVQETNGNILFKIISVHDKWQVFRGDSTEGSDLIFTAKQSSIFQLKTKLDVFLANNIEENVCDFKVKGSWLERSCVVYAGESSIVVAQMHKRNTIQSILLGKDNFMVTVHPNIDYAFIITLIVILDAINATAAATAGGTGGSS